MLIPSLLTDGITVAWIGLAAMLFKSAEYSLLTWTTAATALVPTVLWVSFIEWHKGKKVVPLVFTIVVLAQLSILAGVTFYKLSTSSTKPPFITATLPLVSKGKPSFPSTRCQNIIEAYAQRGDIKGLERRVIEAANLSDDYPSHCPIATALLITTIYLVCACLDNILCTHTHYGQIDTTHYCGELYLFS